MKDFLKNLGISFSRVETLMSYDGHVIFDGPDDMATAHRALADIRINRAPLFFLEAHPDLMKLYFRIDFSEPIDPRVSISIGSQTLMFGDEIAKIIVRTGKHNQNGIIYHNCIELIVDETPEFFNHNLFRFVYPDLFMDDPIVHTKFD